MIYDVIIIGSGPAGANAALELSLHNINVLIIEKEVLPRIKPCGGAMPTTVKQHISIDISAVTRHEVSALHFLHDYQDKVEVETQDQPIIMVNRSEFDMFLVTQAQKRAKGIMKLNDNCAVKNISLEDNSVKIILDTGEVITSRYVIGADGPLGVVSKSLGLMKQKKFAPTLDVEIQTSHAHYQNNKDAMVMNYFCLDKGYGWIFPKDNNTFSCGIGTWGKPFDLHVPLEDFIAKNFQEGSIKEKKIKGYPIPIYNGSMQITKQRVLLAGDAAALVNPVSGEGIRFALHSGKLAASCIVDGLHGVIGEDEVAEVYQQKVAEEIEKELKYKLAFEALAFHHSPKVFYKKFIK